MTNTWKQQYANYTLDHIRQNFPGINQVEQQALCLMEEVGEFVGELRRYLGWARRKGNIETLAEELADVQIVTWVCAEAYGFDLQAELDMPNPPEFSFRGWTTLARRMFLVTTSISNLHVESLGQMVRLTEMAAKKIGIDLDKAMLAKYEKIFHRGWRH